VNDANATADRLQERGKGRQALSRGAVPRTTARMSTAPRTVNHRRIHMNRTGKLITLVGALLLAAGVGAFASNAIAQDARFVKVAVTQDLAAFFSARGVDPQYLSAASSDIPADQLALINRIIATADDPDNAVYTHSELTRLVTSALQRAAVAEYVPYYITLGSYLWEMELGGQYLADGTTNSKWVSL
jgi:hypothetical protein